MEIATSHTDSLKVKTIFLVILEYYTHIYNILIFIKYKEGDFASIYLTRPRSIDLQEKYFLMVQSSGWAR